jgi:hypothetical protein
MQQENSEIVSKAMMFMDQCAILAARDEITPREMIAVYLLVRSSMFDEERTATQIEAADLDLALPPQETFNALEITAEWVFSPAGQRFLDFGHEGKLDAQSIEQACKIMELFGIASWRDTICWAVEKFSGAEAETFGLDVGAQLRKSNPEFSK